MVSITLNSVSLSYPIYSAGSRSLKKRLMKLGVVGGAIQRDSMKVVTIQALQDINLHLVKGDRLALIGHNGAGKSTLLKLLAGIYRPTAGTAEIKGRVGTLLNISLGMDDEATGYENISLIGLFLGLSHARIQEIIPDIVEFSELGDFLEMPLRTYSSGMRLRLAFAISTSIEPEILLMDEVVGVGDAQFMDKATQRLNSLVNKASILVLASHSIPLVRDICNKAVLLEHGKLIASGSVEEVLDIYAEKG